MYFSTSLYKNLKHCPVCTEANQAHGQTFPETTKSNRLLKHFSGLVFQSPGCVRRDSQVPGDGDSHCCGSVSDEALEWTAGRVRRRGPGVSVPAAFAPQQLECRGLCASAPCLRGGSPRVAHWFRVNFQDRTFTTRRVFFSLKTKREKKGAFSNRQVFHVQWFPRAVWNARLSLPPFIPPVLHRCVGLNPPQLQISPARRCPFTLQGHSPRVRGLLH